MANSFKPQNSLLKYDPPKVIHINDAPPGWEKDPNFVYIGRCGKGHNGYFGNPIEFNAPCPVCSKIHTKSDREELLSCFIKHAFERAEEDSEYKERILALKNKTMVCFCKPLSCHGDGLIQLYIALSKKS